MERKLPDWIDTYMEYTNETEPSKLFRKWVAISTIASALQRKVWMKYGSKTIYANMYIVLVGPSGSRKGTAMEPAYDIMRNIGITITPDSATRQVVIKEMVERGRKNTDPETGIITFHSSITIFQTELAVFFGYQERQLLSDLCKWYDCEDRFEYETIGRGKDYVEKVWVNLIGATTPETLQAMLPVEAISGGLTSRIVFVFSRKKERTIPFPMLGEQEEDLQTDLQQILTLHGQFKVTSEVVELFTEWYIQQDNDPPFSHKYLQSYTSRRPNHCLKLMIISSASRSNSMVIEAEDFNRAVAWLSEVEKPMRHVFSGVGKSRFAPAVGWLAQELDDNGKVSYSDFMKAQLGEYTKKELSDIVISMDLAGEAETKEIDGIIYIVKTD